MLFITYYIMFIFSIQILINDGMLYNALSLFKTCLQKTNQQHAADILDEADEG